MGAKTKGLKRLANQINRAYSAGAEQGNQLAQAELKAALKARRNQTWRSASGYRRADWAWKAQDAADNVSLVSNGGMGITEESLAAYEKAQESTKSAWKYAQSKNSSGKMGKTKEQIRAENRQRLDDAVRLQHLQRIAVNDLPGGITVHADALLSSGVWRDDALTVQTDAPLCPDRRPPEALLRCCPPRH